MTRDRDRIQSVWGDRTPYHGEHQWPVRMDDHALEEPDRWVQSCCMLCSNGYGLVIGVAAGLGAIRFVVFVRRLPTTPLLCPELNRMVGRQDNFSAQFSRR